MTSHENSIVQANGETVTHLFGLTTLSAHHMGGKALAYCSCGWLGEPVAFINRARDQWRKHVSGLENGQ